MSPRQKKETMVCITAAHPATATAVSELPLNFSRGVSPFTIATRFSATAEPVRSRLNTAYAAGATGIAEMIESGKMRTIKAMMIAASAITPDRTLRKNSLRMFSFSSNFMLSSSSSPV